MGKPKLFIDFDGTIVNSIKAFCDVYNSWYKYHEDFMPADWTKCNKWDFSDVCPNLNGLIEPFSSREFFLKLEFYPDAKEVLYELSKHYNITIVSIGSHKNIARKSMWIHENLSFIDNAILIKNDGCRMDKSVINMEGGIFVDDHIDNLKHNNAMISICYGNTYEWNEDWQGIRLKDWNKVKKFLLGGIAHAKGNLL